MPPARLAPALFALMLSGVMSLLVSGVAAWRALGSPPDFAALRLQAWTFSWAVAFPTAFVLAPVVRRLVARLTRPLA